MRRIVLLLLIAWGLYPARKRGGRVGRGGGGERQEREREGIVTLVSAQQGRYILWCMLHMRLSAYKSVKWSDLSCGIRRLFVCE